MHVLFVCTGNICRSPMAEGIARARFGYVATFGSAGTRPILGSPPTQEAQQAASELEVDIGDLRAASISSEIDRMSPDIVLVMTQDHADEVRRKHPELSDRIELLDSDGDVADPYGYPLAEYRRTRDQIAAAIEKRGALWADR